MARGGGSPLPTPLPKVSFVKVQDGYSSQPAGVHDNIAKVYGYNDGSDFERPQHYLRYIEPLESELAEQVEYDMDEQDQEWLDAVNAERKKLQLDSVSYEFFEIVMDRLEKEWFDLTKNVPKPDMALPSEDSTCAICDDSEGENTNAIVFCDGCNLAVHQDCYGVPYIPEGQWLCRKCTVSPENPVSCILCPNEGGAFKQTAHGDWVHLLCAIWVPETRVANDVFMEPITGIDKISKQRWRLKCSICDVREGACVQCTKASCFLAFHATCARKEKLLMPMKATQGSEAPTLACFCEKHLPKEQADIRDAALVAERAAEGEGGDEKNPSPKSSKTARAYAKTYKPGPPLVPHIIVERILQYITRLKLREKREFVLLVCKYWSLKREARRGAAFLKRLHLEPWTASSTGRQQTEEEKTIKLEYLKRLRQDLDSMRKIAALCQDRENQKLERVHTIQEVLNIFLFRHESTMRLAFERIRGADRQGVFQDPVSKADVPDYYDIIKRPMSWSVIDRKLDGHEYLDLREFKDDVNLVISNAMTYNKPTTPFYKVAQKIQTTAEPILAELHKLSSRQAPNDQGVETQEVFLSEIGDLEPPLPIIDMLLSDESFKEDIDLILNKDPLASLYSYELPKMKPPPPLPPPPPPKIKIDRRAALARKRQERMDKGPGFRAPRTRRAAAVYAQFEEEVGEQTSAVGTAETSATVTITQPEAGPSSQPARAEGGTPSKSGRKPKRSIQPGTQAEAPQMVEGLDSRQSFAMFDKGWILSPDTRRGNRPRQPPPPAPTPKKKGKTIVVRGKSHLSAFSTTAAENETLLAAAPGPQMLPEQVDTSIAKPHEHVIAEAGTSNVSVEEPPDIHIEDVSAGPALETFDEPMDIDQPSVEPPVSASDIKEARLPEEAESQQAETQPDVQTEVQPEALPDMQTKVQTEALPDVPPEALPEDVQPLDMQAETQSEEAQPEALPDVQAAADPAALPDVPPDAPMDVQVELQPEVKSEVQPDVQPEAPTEVQPQVEREVSPQARPEVPPPPQLEVQPEAQPEAQPQLAAQPQLDAPAQPEMQPDVTLQIESQAPVERPEPQPTVVDVPDTPAVRRERLARRRSDKLRMGLEPAPQPAPDVSSPIVSTLPDGRTIRREGDIVVIEELDTPAIRRRKHLLRKVERARLEAEAAAAAAGIDPHAPAQPGVGEQNVAGVSQPSERAIVSQFAELEDVDMGSELSSLSDLSDEEREAQETMTPPPPPPPPRPIQPIPRRQSTVVPLVGKGREDAILDRGLIQLEPGTVLEGGTLVWAKMDAFPWWPAVIFESDDPYVPPEVFRFHKAPQGGDLTHLVRFFDKRNSWQWVPLDKLRMLGEDNEFDELMLTHSKLQKFKHKKVCQECRDAYRRAMAEKETDGEGDHAPESEDDTMAIVNEPPTITEPPAEVSTSVMIQDDGLGGDSPMTEVE